ncbi:hypothetical protein ACHQM5_025743 [Ranunculus cassubicifolius]
MNVGALLTSAGINIGLCAVLLTFYSVLRKQPKNVSVYFARRLAQERLGRDDSFCIERIFPSPSWLVKAWEISEDEILAIGGLDAVVFFRILLFSIRIFSIAAVICLLLVLPLNYYGQQKRIHKEIHAESLDVFTIANVQEGSRGLWAHCLALYIITLSSFFLLYSEYQNIARMRVTYVTGSHTNPSHFTILVRAIPWSVKETYSDSVKKFFTNYHASTYLSHQMAYRSGTVQKLMDSAEYMYKKLSKYRPTSLNQVCEPCLIRCNFCGGTTNYFKIASNEADFEEKPNLEHLETNLAQINSDKKEKESGAAFVFFRSRYAAFAAAHVLQSSNPMYWVTDPAPEPHDVYWSNIWLPYKQLWVRKILVLVATFFFMLFFLGPVTFVQGLSQLEKLQKSFPILRGLLETKLMIRLVTGYLPSVVLMLFLYTVPPTMTFFSTAQGTISRSERKRSACCKVLYFMIWNVFFVSVLSGSVISKYNAIWSPKDIPAQLATAVPRQATFFITYVLTSGWAGLCSELMQLFVLFCNFFYRVFLCHKEGPSSLIYTFPYHTEVPKLLLFGLLGFTCSILAPLILPFLLLYFFLGFIVYRNQFLNVYITKYDTGGKYWPIAHNTTIFSLILMQIIALGVFGLKNSPVASGFTIPLDLVEMDRKDEMRGNMDEIYEEVQSAYTQFSLISSEMCEAEASNLCEIRNQETIVNDVKPNFAHPSLGGLSLSGIQQATSWLSFFTSSEKNLPK